MPDIFADWYTHRVDVDTLLSTDFSGAQTAEHHEDVPCFVEDTREWMVVGEGARESLEQRPVTVLYAGLSDRGKFAPGSTVTLPDGRTGIVRSVSIGDGGLDIDGITVKIA